MILRSTEFRQLGPIFVMLLALTWLD